MALPSILIPSLIGILWLHQLGPIFSQAEEWFLAIGVHGNSGVGNT